MKKNTDKKIALFAGALALPFLARDALHKHGWEVFVIGLKIAISLGKSPEKK